MKQLLTKIAIIAAALPVLAYPALLSRCPDEPTAALLVKLYPAYVLGAAICAWLCMRKRAEMTWILLVLMLLSHAAMWLLVNNPAGL